MSQSRKIERAARLDYTLVEDMRGPAGQRESGPKVYLLPSFYFAILAFVFALAFGSGGGSAFCAGLGPVRVGIPVVSPS